MSSGGSPVSGLRRIPSRRRSQVALAVVAALLIVVFSFGGFLAGLLTDSWWFRDLGHHSVWSTRIVTTAVLFAIGVVVTGLLGVLIAATVTRSVPINPPDQGAARLRLLFGGRPRALRIAGVGALVLLMAPALAGNTSTVLLLINGDASGGPKDPLFGRPLGFYFFVLPFLRALTGWLLALLAVSILATLVAAYLVGAWRPGRRGGELSPGLRGLVGGLGAAWFVLRGVGYLLDRWSLVSSGRGYVDGPGATDLRTRLPGLAVLAGVAFIVAVIIVIGTVRRDVIPSIVGGVAWLIVAVVVLQVVPRAYNQLEVRPNSPGIERTPIQRNVNATRAAYGLAAIDTEDLDTAPSESTEAAPALATELTANARIWGPAQRTIAAFNKVVSLDYLRVIDVDMDRYVIDGREQLVAVGALDRVALKSETWSQKHLERTHGYGVMVAPAGEVVGEGEPRIVASGIRKSAISAREPRLYVGEDANSYVVVGTPSEVDVAALDAPAADGSAKVKAAKYTGRGGVAIGGFWKKAVFALHFGDRNLLVRSLPSTGKVMYVRDVRARAEKLAPFLRFGADPYPVVLADRVVWVLDGYTVSDHYPYAQRFATGSVLDVRSGLSRGGFNYVRAAVRVVIDAYDGDVKMYRAAGRGTDPLIDAWARTYPSLFAPSSQLEKDRPGLSAHLRYPEDLLRLQSSALGRYHVTTAAAFVDLANDWTPSIAAPVASGANDPNATSATSSTPAADGRRSEDRAQVDPDDDAQVAAPLYLRHRYPGQAAPTFVLQQSLELRRSTGQRRLLRALVVADTNTERFGRLRVLLVPAAAEALGPARAFDRMRANPRVSTIETQLGQVGSQVNFGDVQVLATTAGLVYQRPMFLKPESSDLQELKYVLVLAGNRVTIEPSVAAAFEKALTGSVGSATGSPTVPSTPTPSTPAETPAETPVDANATVGELLDDAAASLAAAETALKDGDLGLYQQRVEDARRQIEAAREASKPKTS